MKKVLLLLIATSSCASLMGMQMENQVIPLSAMPNQNAVAEDITIVLPKNHCWSRQQHETLNASDIETLTQSSFDELIKERHLQNQAYALARVITTQNVQENGSNSPKTFIHYFDVAESKKITDNLNPINRIAIEKTDCYNINPNNPRRAIHAFTVLSSLSHMNTRASGACDMGITCGSFECVQSACQSKGGCLKCSSEATVFMCACLPGTLCTILAPAADSVLLPCTIIACLCHRLDCGYLCTISRKVCPNYCEEFCFCFLNCCH